MRGPVDFDIWEGIMSEKTEDQGTPDREDGSSADYEPPTLERGGKLHRVINASGFLDVGGGRGDS